jgi:Glycosyl transferase family 2
MESRVSVVVPLYNKAPYIERCLDSILSQTVGDLEVIVVNDGSTDGGEEVVRRCRDDRVRLITQANSGPGAARNRGAAESRAPILAMLDGDDAWDLDYIERSLRCLDLGIASVSWGSMEFPLRQSTGRRWAGIGIPDGPYRVSAATPPRLLAGMVSNMLPSSTVIRKDVFESLGGFYAKNRCLFAEDAYLWLKLLLRHKVEFQAAPLVRRFCDASELSMNLKGPRPIEPFLLDPAELWECCPAELRPLARKFLALRACKTASVYGYFHQPAQARALVRKFVSARDCNLPFFFLALTACTPLAQWLGLVARLSGLNLRERTGRGPIPEGS